PFTATLPAVMSCSALRREVTPAAAMIFCKRSMNSFQHKKLTTDFTDSADWKKTSPEIRVIRVIRGKVFGFRQLQVLLFEQRRQHRARLLRTALAAPAFRWPGSRILPSLPVCPLR